MHLRDDHMFIYYQTSPVEIDVQHPIFTCTHNQNGSVESLIKRLQVIMRTLLFQYNYRFLYGTFYITCWCIHLWLTTYHQYLPLQLVIGHWIAHILKIFDCVVYLLIVSLAWSKIRILYHMLIHSFMTHYLSSVFTITTCNW